MSTSALFGSTLVVESSSVSAIKIPSKLFYFVGDPHIRSMVSAGFSVKLLLSPAGKTVGESSLGRHLLQKFFRRDFSKNIFTNKNE